MPVTRTGRVTVAALTLVLLSACGGGGGDGAGGPASNMAPIANAGAARTVDVGSVTLNGTGSSDSDGSITSYTWTQTAGTSLTLGAANTAQPNFVAPQSTVTATFTFQLIVTDNLGATSNPSAVTITVNGNAVPIANAGAPQTVEAGAAVALNGAASSDPDGTVSSWTWTQTSGAAVTLGNATSATPGFTAPVASIASTITFQLIVRDNRGVASNASTVTIAVNANAVPIANAGAPQTVASGAAVTLNGAASSDPDGTVTSWSWTQASGAAVTLGNATSATPGFTAPVASIASTLTFQLIVTDNRGVASAPASVTITVNANLAPVANAGSPRTIGSGSSLVLNGTASSDPDGTIVSWSWTQTAGPAVTLNNATTASPGFTAPAANAASSLTFRLIVTDNGGASSAPSSVTINVNANVPPVAIAGMPQTVTSGTTVTLDGRSSVDSDGTVVGYAWTQSAGTAVTLSGANTAQPTFIAPLVATTANLTFQLVVTDNVGATSSASTVTIRVDANMTPGATAGVPQTVGSGASVTLSGTASDQDGTIVSYSWTQTGGTAVSLGGANTLNPTFTAPTVTVSTTLTFSLVVTDNLGATNVNPATTTVTVTPYVTLSGVVRFQRVPFQVAAPFGLDYANPVWQPARGIAVKATQIGGPVVGTAVTDSNGNYTMSVPSGMTVSIHAVAKMVRDSSQPLPRWDVRVQPLATTTYTPIEYFSGLSSSSAGTYNVDIASGVAANGTAMGARTTSSGPFAILDTIYTAMQAVLSVAPNTSFPELYVDWGAQTQGTFFTTQNGQHIALLSDLTQDTDEYDQHVIAHEFGHYVERNFSRADNIGGSHGFGDKLDMRVAFGEGFGYAFAAIVLNDPFTHDSLVFNGTQVSSVFNVETNPPATGVDAGCWCSESSVWSILWDLHDNVSDGNDNISLPFSAIWDVLVNSQRLTPSVTSIFSFTAALKANQPAFAGLINPLLSAQNINSGAIDAFATNETYLPYPAMTLPLIPTITKGGGPVVVRSIGDASRHYNKAGNRALLQFTALSSGPITVSLTTSNIAADRDPDFYVRNNGILFWGGVNSFTEYPETETFSVTAGQTYIIDAYDCANGCSGTAIQGTPGDYDLTVTIN